MRSAPAWLAVPVALSLAAACAAPPGPPDPDAELSAARSDLASAGFEFAADVAFVLDPYVVCEAMSCAELQVRSGRRTVLLAREAWDSPARLRATLLDIWGLYQRPRAASYGDKAESALRVLQHGPDAGIDDRAFLRRVYHRYRQLYASVPEGERAQLPRPDDLAYP